MSQAFKNFEFSLIFWNFCGRVVKVLLLEWMLGYCPSWKAVLSSKGVPHMRCLFPGCWDIGGVSDPPQKSSAGGCIHNLPLCCPGRPQEELSGRMDQGSWSREFVLSYYELEISVCQKWPFYSVPFTSLNGTISPLYVTRDSMTTSDLPSHMDFFVNCFILTGFLLLYPYKKQTSLWIIFNFARI